MRTTGTQVRGIRAPIIRQGDDLVAVVCDSVLKSAEIDGYTLNDRDVVGITESILARAQGNYATVGQIAGDVRQKAGGGTLGVVFPILSRNRFAIPLKGIARGAERVIVQLSYPADEVGNSLVSLDALDGKGIDPHTYAFTGKEWRKLFGKTVHRFTGVDYIEYYESLADNIEIVLANDPRHILKLTEKVIACDIHNRARTKRILKNAGAEQVLGLDDILNAPYENSGYNETYGLLGSNKTTDESVKLFPRECEKFVVAVQSRLKAETGKDIEVLVYGDGAFKDPVGGIWELADPVVSPAYTKGICGTPNELKLKFLADDKYRDLNGKELEEALKAEIRKKDSDLSGKMESEGTTPRRLCDMLGSLCDLVSGSGDKGTPIVLIQGYFDNYAV
jgi:hypothetical protein